MSKVHCVPLCPTEHIILPLSLGAQFALSQRRFEVVRVNAGPGKLVAKSNQASWGTLAAAERAQSSGCRRIRTREILPRPQSLREQRDGLASSSM